MLYQLSYVPSLIRRTPRDLSQQMARGADGPPAIERPPQIMRNECRGRSRPEVATSIALSANSEVDGYGSPPLGSSTYVPHGHSPDRERSIRARRAQGSRQEARRDGGLIGRRGLGADAPPMIGLWAFEDLGTSECGGRRLFGSKIDVTCFSDVVSVAAEWKLRWGMRRAVLRPTKPVRWRVITDFPGNPAPGVPERDKAPNSGWYV